MDLSFNEELLVLLLTQPTLHHNHNIKHKPSFPRTDVNVFRRQWHVESSSYNICLRSLAYKAHLKFWRVTLGINIKSNSFSTTRVCAFIGSRATCVFLVRNFFNLKLQNPSPQSSLCIIIIVTHRYIWI